MVHATSVCRSFAANEPLPLEQVPIFTVADFFDIFLCGPDNCWQILERTTKRRVSESGQATAAPGEVLVSYVAARL